MSMQNHVLILLLGIIFFIAYKGEKIKTDFSRTVSSSVAAVRKMRTTWRRSAAPVIETRTGALLYTATVRNSFLSITSVFFTYIPIFLRARTHKNVSVVMEVFVDYVFTTIIPMYNTKLFLHDNKNVQYTRRLLFGSASEQTRFGRSIIFVSHTRITHTRTYIRLKSNNDCVHVQNYTVFSTIIIIIYAYNKLYTEHDGAPVKQIIFFFCGSLVETLN